METKPGKKGISLNCEQYQKMKVEHLFIYNEFFISKLIAIFICAHQNKFCNKLIILYKWLKITQPTTF